MPPNDPTTKQPELPGLAAPKAKRSRKAAGKPGAAAVDATTPAPRASASGEALDWLCAKCGKRAPTDPAAKHALGETRSCACNGTAVVVLRPGKKSRARAAKVEPRSPNATKRRQSSEVTDDVPHDLKPSEVRKRQAMARAESAWFGETLALARAFLASTVTDEDELEDNCRELFADEAFVNARLDARAKKQTPRAFVADWFCVAEDALTPAASKAPTKPEPEAAPAAQPSAPVTPKSKSRPNKYTGGTTVPETSRHAPCTVCGQHAYSNNAYSDRGWCNDCETARDRHAESFSQVLAAKLDLVAIAAMQDAGRSYTADHFADIAYRLADAMVRRRARE